MYSESGNYYKELVVKNKKSKKLASAEEIEKDLHRTFPGHELFGKGTDKWEEERESERCGERDVERGMGEREARTS